MTEQELQDLVISQDEKIKELEGQVSEAKQKVEAAKSAPSSSGGLTEEQIKELQEKAKLADEATKKAQELQSQIDQSTLEKEFPQIKDWSVVVGTNLEERKSHAAKIAAMIGGGAPEVSASKGAPQPTGDAPAPDKGDAWQGAPGTGSPAGEAQAAQERVKKVEDLKARQKSNDISGVLDACMALQPKATENLFAGTARKK